MALSEHEQRVLDEIENALYQEDPKFVSTVRSSGARRRAGRATVTSGLVFLLGVVLLVGGIAVPGPGILEDFKLISVLGFLVMFGAGVLFLGGGAAESGKAPVVDGGARQGVRAGGGRSTGRGRAPGGFVSRMEERFNRRFDEM